MATVLCCVAGGDIPSGWMTDDVNDRRTGAGWVMVYRQQHIRTLYRQTLGRHWYRHHSHWQAVEEGLAVPPAMGHDHWHHQGPSPRRS